MDSERRHQLELLASPEAPHIEPLTPELIASIRRKRTFLAAWNFGQDFSGLEDKQCYVPLQMDSSHWSKIRKGNASPPGDDRLNRYLDVIQNEFPLVWWAESRGYDWLTIRKHRSAEQRENEELRAENESLKRAFRLAFGQSRRDGVA